MANKNPKGESFYENKKIYKCFANTRDDLQHGSDGDASRPRVG